MVEKKSRITRKPAPEAVEGFLEQLGTDPESSLPKPAPAPPTPPPANPQDDGNKGKAFPHRLSADFTTDQYKRLKRAGFETDQPMTTIVREAVEDWLKARGY
ncbi:hypothetical protein IQ265_28105 [Nodosilinea sp. LEGE 06152]|uniref:hypothetical protein n=1 Tax=Nodosilinea sp. LEGE 06152 TaxID=2777966 RepID=UPI001881ECEB|nr:hypothetical protein [Nodosilinea sp. LEGE 06152]MBE9160656.1 hypothetical protein [Nodosilinea sp. LEGE 06152]